MAYKVCKRRGYIDKVDCIEDETDSHVFFDSIIEAYDRSQIVANTPDIGYYSIFLLRKDLKDCRQFYSIDDLKKTAGVGIESIVLNMETILIDVGADLVRFSVNPFSDENNASILSRMKKYIEIYQEEKLTHSH